METKQWTTVDKSEWGPGLWQVEPDKLQWTDEATGLPCLIVRGPAGALCGYVGLAKGHPLFQVDYSECPEKCSVDSWCAHTPGSRLKVHGGLTFAAFCAESDDPARHICHVPGPGEPDRVW